MPGMTRAGQLVETCSDVVAGDPIEQCECGKKRLRGRPCGWRMPGSILIGRVEPYEAKPRRDESGPDDGDLNIEDEFFMVCDALTAGLRAVGKAVA